MPALENTQPIPHNARKAQSWAGSSYVLPADEKEFNRLNIQHQMLKKAFDNKLVQAPIVLEDVKDVLESGAGTGVWLRDLADLVPSTTRLQAIDIETGMFPKDYPSNVTISKESITNLPQDWSNQFDLVHQRFLIAGLRTSEWVTAIAEMYRVLRPGGWLDMTEASEFIVGRAALSGAQAKLVQVLQRDYFHYGLLLHCASYLPMVMEQTGFCNVKVERRFFPLGQWGGEEGTKHLFTLGEVYRGMKPSVLRAGGFGLVNSEADYDKLMDDVENEWNTVGGTGTYYYTIIAQKPVGGN